MACTGSWNLAPPVHTDALSPRFLLYITVLTGTQQSSEVCEEGAKVRPLGPSSVAWEALAVTNISISRANTSTAFVPHGEDSLEESIFLSSPKEIHMIQFKLNLTS